MAHTHEFDCPVCGSHLDSREQLEQHTAREHPDAARNASGADGQAAGQRAPSPGSMSNGSRDRSQLN